MPTPLGGALPRRSLLPDFAARPGRRGTGATRRSGTTSDLFSLVVLDTADGLAFGAGGTVLHYAGTAGSPAPTGGVTATLRAAAVAVDTTTGAVTGYFVVGDGGTILHVAGGVIRSPQPSGTTKDVFGVAVTSNSDAVAVGALGTILHYDGTSWTAQR